MSVVSKGLRFLAVSSRAAILPMLCGKLAPGVWKVAVGETLRPLTPLLFICAASRMGISLGGVMMSVRQLMKSVPFVVRPEILRI